MKTFLIFLLLAQLHSPTSVTTTVAPESPVSLQVLGDLTGNQHVYLYWQGGDDVVNAPLPALTGVNVYRSEQSGGPYALVNSSPLPITDPRGSIQYEDFPRLGTTWYYVMTEVDSSGAETDFSPEMQAILQ